MGKVASFFREQKIALAIGQQQQMVALDREFESLKSQVVTLQSENLNLRAEVKPLKQEVERLKQQIEKEKAGFHKLDPIEIEILKAIASCPYGITSRELQARLHLSQSRAAHFLGLLSRARYVLMNMLTSRYVLSQKGNAYIVDNNLDK